MASITMGHYLQFIEEVYSSSDGIALARALSLDDEHVLNENLWKPNIPALVSGRCIAPLDELVINHLMCVKALHAQSFYEAYRHQDACVSIIVRLLEIQHGCNWMLPVMYAVSLDLRLTAQKADNYCNSRGAILERASYSILACFRVCATDPEPLQKNNKKQGMLNIVNHLLRIYFKINKYHLCHYLIGAAEPMVSEGLFSLAQQVTFRYYLGRLALLEANFSVANKNLTFAFRNCHPYSFKNKRMILTYLLPVKMILGYMPSQYIVQHFDLPLCWDLLSSVRDGNLKKFEYIVKGNWKYFNDSGLMVALENLRVIVFRNVLKKVYQSQKTNRIPVSCFRAGLQLLTDYDFNISETQNLIASMIYTNKMSAYMSYQHEVVIFSADPFPNPSSQNYLD